MFSCCSFFFVVKLLFSFLICFPLEFGARELATLDWYIFSREYQTKQNEKNRNNGPQANVLWGRRVFGCSAYVSVCVELCVSCCCCCCSRSALTTERLKVSNGTERDWTRVRARKPSSSTSSSLSQSSLPLSCTQTIAALHETQWQWRNGRQASSERARERREWERALVFRFPHAACVNCGLWATLRLHCKARVRLQSAAAASLSLLLLQRDFHYENYLNKFFELRAYPPRLTPFANAQLAVIYLFIFSQRLLHYLLCASNDALVLHFSSYLAQIL